MTIVATISLPRVWENKDLYGEVFESEYEYDLKYVSPEVKTAPLKVMQNLKKSNQSHFSMRKHLLDPC